MFDNGSITDYATPESVRKSSELFSSTYSQPEHSLRIFEKRKQKWDNSVRLKCLIFLISYNSKCILLVSVTNTKGIPGGVIPPSPPAKTVNCKIPELGAGSLSLPSIKRSCPVTLEVPVEIINPPYNTWQYTDHDVETDYVCVAVNIFTGSNSISFDITEDGLKIIVRLLGRLQCSRQQKCSQKNFKMEQYRSIIQ